ncbi:MAG TPA: hypothetical protein VJ850_09110 [Candidatus Limnocylindrales bacterium]|nr:hypothetical protein [Candidatus Limnocylindrales bacterium]
MRHIELVNPRDDDQFGALVDQLAGTAGDPHELEQGLRESYPSAVVRSRGLAAEPVDVWYVYRDGSWTPVGSDGPAEGT